MISMRETLNGIIEQENGTVVTHSFTTGSFQGIIYSYGRVELIELAEEDRLKIKFEYDIHEGKVPDNELRLFEDEIARHLDDLLSMGLESRNIVFSGKAY